ncbi:hypothetical protein N9B82_06450 [Saprospiraceae bacterium]|nr:hypothetical protein [Saprospiraceae bacterium]
MKKLLSILTLCTSALMFLDEPELTEQIVKVVDSDNDERVVPFSVFV